jgi:hypothetical protein
MISIMWQLDHERERAVPPGIGRYITYHLYCHEKTTFWLAKETGINYQKLRRIVLATPHPVTGNMDRISASDAMALEKWCRVSAINWMFLQALHDLQEEQNNERVDKRRRYERRDDDIGSDNGEAHLLSGGTEEVAEATTGS